MYNTDKWHGHRDGCEYGSITTIEDLNGYVVVQDKLDSNAYIREWPYAQAEQQGDALQVGQVIKVKRSVTNSKGNTWYKTYDNYYVWSGYVSDIYEYTDFATVQGSFKALKGGHTKPIPYQEAASVDSIAVGDLLQVTAIVKNSYGNLWVQLEDGTFTCLYDLSANEHILEFVQDKNANTFGQQKYDEELGLYYADGGTITVNRSTLTLPTSLTYGKTFNIKGTISSASLPLLSVTIRITDLASGEKALADTVGYPDISKGSVKI